MFQKEADNPAVYAADPKLEGVGHTPGRISSSLGSLQTASFHASALRWGTPKDGLSSVQVPIGDGPGSGTPQDEGPGRVWDSESLSLVYYRPPPVPYSQQGFLELANAG